MHPLVVLVPVAALIFGPRIWVKQVLKQHNRKEEEGLPTGRELAKEFLARHQLQEVKIESSDIGDHYDPKAKAVRLTRDKLERKTLTAITTAAHEVAHAVQDASAYGPFVWRMRLVTLAQTTGQAGSVILIAVPAVSMFTRQAVPPIVIGAAALTMLGTGMAAQLVALPTELDASFGRAMPLLKDGYITESQAKDARKILVASSLTYLASSLLAVLNIWPWLGWWGPVRCIDHSHPSLARCVADDNSVTEQAMLDTQRDAALPERYRKPGKPGVLVSLTRQFGKPLIRGWFRLYRAS